MPPTTPDEEIEAIVDEIDRQIVCSEAMHTSLRWLLTQALTQFTTKNQAEMEVMVGEILSNYGYMVAHCGTEIAAVTAVDVEHIKAIAQAHGITINT